MKSSYAKRQHGAALLAMLAILALGASWYLVSRLNADSGAATATRKVRNAEVLNRAKQALIGYVATQAAEAGERNPGRLPCPEDANNIGTSSEGIVPAPPGTFTCTSIGRLPWRTLGLEKLVDTVNEPLWYVVGPSWRLTTNTSTLLINSNIPSGDITVDGQQVVALIIAPGAAMNVQTATGCTARNQARSTPSPTMNALDYIECFDPAILPILQFVTTASSTSFNDQVVRITVADIMPAIEAAIANRIEREILPALQTAYTAATWGFTGANPVLPFAAPFASPGSGVGTSNYQGEYDTTDSTKCPAVPSRCNLLAGLLPFNQTENCTVSAADPRCTTALSLLAYAKGPADVKTGGSGSIRTQSACSTQGNYFVCLGDYLQPSISVTVQVKISNVATGLRTRKVNPFVWEVTFEAMNDTTGGWGTQVIPHTVTDNGLQADGSWQLTIAGTTLLPDIATAGWGTYANYRVTVKQSDIGAKFGDHALLSSTDSTTGWFVRNEWYRLLYYAVSQGNTAARLPSERSCTAAGNCLTVANMTPSTSKSAALILAGRSINGSARPSPTLADYLEFGNATAAYERRTVSARNAIAPAQRFNDRIVVIDSN